MRVFFSPRPCSFVHVEPRGYWLHRFPLVYSQETVYKLRRTQNLLLAAWRAR